MTIAPSNSHRRLVLILLSWLLGSFLLASQGVALDSGVVLAWTFVLLLLVWTTIRIEAPPAVVRSGEEGRKEPFHAEGAKDPERLSRIFSILVRDSTPDSGAEHALVRALEEHDGIQAVRVSLVDHDLTEIEMAASSTWSTHLRGEASAPKVLQFALPDWGSSLSYQIDVLPRSIEVASSLKKEVEWLAPLLTAHLNGLAALRETELARIALRQTNRQLEATRKRILAQERTALLGRLIANMSHELNNPILGIQGTAAVLERMIDDEERASLVRTISAECRRCAEILNCVISLGDEETPSRTAVRLDDAITQASSLLSYKARQAEVRIEHLHPSNTPSVQADAVLLRQAMLNLIESLLRDLEEAPAPRRLSIETQPGMDHVRVCMRTSPLAAGAPGTSTTTATKLALWVTEAVIEALGGHFEAYRKPGEEAAVTLLVPLRAHISTVEKDLRATLAAPSISLSAEFARP